MPERRSPKQAREARDRALVQARRAAVKRFAEMIFPPPKEPHLLLNRGAKKMLDRDVQQLEPLLQLFINMGGPEMLEMFEAPEETRKRSKIQET